MNNKKKIYCILYGGLGNQLFQYSFAKSISLRSDRDLIFISGRSIFSYFSIKKNNKSNDKNYVNSFDNKINLLSLLEIKTTDENIFFNIFYYIVRFIKISHRKLNLKINKILNFEIICEKILDYESNIEKTILESRSKKLIIHGYWQSEKYFSSNFNIFKNNFKIPQSPKLNFLEIYKKIKSINSVALCIRAYEDIPGNENLKKIDDSLMSGTPTLNYYNNAINYLRKKIKNPTFFVFSSKKFSFLKELNLGPNVYFINNDNGFKGTIENFWLMSNFKNLIISYSSYYWWSCYLAGKLSEDVNVYRPKKNNALDIKSDYYPNNWIKIEYD